MLINFLPRDDLDAAIVLTIKDFKNKSVRLTTIMFDCWYFPSWWRDNIDVRFA